MSTLVKSDEKLALGSSDDTVLTAGESDRVNQLNKVCERIEQEKTYADSARSEVNGILEQIKTDPKKLEAGLKQALAVEQNLETNRKQIKPHAFTVFAQDEQGNRYEHPDPSVRVSNILIHTEDLPVSEEKAAFLVDIDRTMMVINQVLKPEGFHSKWGLDGNRDRHAKYFRALWGICHVGLEHDDPSQLMLAKKLGAARSPPVG